VPCRSTTLPIAPAASTEGPPPYGSYDVANDEGWVNVGTTADAAKFAVELIRRLVGPAGHVPIPRRGAALDYRRRRRLQGDRLRAWKVQPLASQRHRSLDHGMPLPARDVEMEPHRAQDVQVHHH